MKLFLIGLGVSSLLVISFLPKQLLRKRQLLQVLIFTCLFILINFRTESYLIDIDLPETFDIQEVTYQEKKATELIYLDSNQIKQSIDLTDYNYDKNTSLEKGSITQHTFAKQYTLVIFNRIRIPLTQTKPFNKQTIHLFDETSLYLEVNK